MKKAFVFVVLVMVALGSCSTKQKVEGAWTDNEGITWVFSKDGKVTQDGEEEFEYAITDTQFSLSQGGQTAVFDFSISADGKTLLLNSSRYGSRTLTKIYNKPTSGGGTFTLTNIPSRYDGKYAVLEGENFAESPSSYREFFGGEKHEGTTFTAIRISEGKVILPMWVKSLDSTRYTRYSGDHLVHFTIYIHDSGPIAKNDEIIQEIIFGQHHQRSGSPVYFYNGSAIKSWSDGSTY